MQENQKKYAVYVVHFSNDRIKVGISSQVHERMKYYAQEARRNGVEFVTWWSCKEFDSKSIALFTERILCNELREGAIHRHREWFYGGSKAFAAVIGAVERLRKRLGTEVGNELLDVVFYGDTGSFDLRAAA